MNEKKRYAKKNRSTLETRIQLSLCIDGNGESDIKTGVGFLDHMLQLMSKHAGFDIRISAEGDLDVDDHHTTEDVGIVMGDAFREALEDKSGISRFADVSVPMQESLVSVSVDICGRPYLCYEVEYPTEKVGDFDTDLVEEFFQAFITHSGVTMHIKRVRGINSHHIAESVFKAVARALRSAVALDPGMSDDIPSTKGVL